MSGCTPTDGTERRVVTKPSVQQAEILDAFGVDTSAWSSRLNA